MDLKDIQELIKFVAKSGATDVNLEIDNIKISIKSPPKKKRGEEEVSVIRQVQTVAAAPVAAPVAAPNHEIEIAKKNIEESNYITIKASMIGTFYRSASPESPPFVNVGDTIKEGDTLCVIEAMKLFNEIESEISGKIIKVLVDDSSPIEFDQELFLVDPS